MHCTTCTTRCYATERFLCFGVLPGSAEALARWSGKIKHLLTAKKYQNRFMFVQVIASHACQVTRTNVPFWSEIEKKQT